MIDSGGLDGRHRVAETPSAEQRPVLPGSRSDRLALTVWLSSWAGVMFCVALTPRALPGSFHQGQSFLSRWNHWDVTRFITLAQHGYAGDPALYGDDKGWPAFFPGYPVVLHAVGLVIPSLEAAGLLISLVAGAVAAVALARLADCESGGTGPYAVIAMVASPAALFLFAGYSESLFLALALPAWLLARRGRWEWAVSLAALSSFVRITGAFLAVALIVEYLTGPAGRRLRGWRPLPLLAVPFLPLLVYTVYQWNRTGDWMAWQHAQVVGWQRNTVWPWESFLTTWNAAMHTDNQFTLAFRVELVAAAVGVLLVCYLLGSRRWPEATYVGLQLAALVTSSFYLSIGRTTLIWWPLWLAVARLHVRWRPAYAAVVAVSAPVAVLFLLIFTSGAWIG